MDLEFFKPLIESSPELAKIFGWLIAIQTISKFVSEGLFFVARICGGINRPWAKWLGKASWELARLFGTFGFGTSKRYIEAKYIERKKPSKR